MKIKTGDLQLLLNKSSLVLYFPLDPGRSNFSGFLGIQDLLLHPNPDSPAQREAIEIFLRDKTEYSKRVQEQARRNVPDSSS